MPAYGWLQRVRHNTYTVCYRVLVADHHLLVDHPPPRPAHLIRTVILHNSKDVKSLSIELTGARPAHLSKWTAGDFDSDPT
jgi:hypothetical protein